MSSHLNGITNNERSKIMNNNDYMDCDELAILIRVKRDKRIRKKYKKKKNTN